MWRLAVAVQASRPQTWTPPRSGRICPAARRISVLLPAPLAPTNPVMPGRSSKVTWLTPMTGPYHLETLSNSSVDGGRWTGSVDGGRWTVDGGRSTGAGAGTDFV